MSEDALKKATQLVKQKSFEEALDVLRPLVPRREMHGPALYVMGYVHEKKGDLGLARYLYMSSLGLDPNQAVVLRRLEKFDEKYAGRKDEIEAIDYEDESHRACWSCSLRYSREEESCPYCGAPIDEPPARVRDEIFEDAAEMTKGAREQAGKLGRELLDKVSKWMDPEDVEKVKQKAREFGKKGSEKAREIANRDEVKNAAERAREIGEEAMQKARHYVDEERQKYDKADDQGRQMLLIKWGGMIGALVLLYLLFGPGGCL